MLNRNSRFLVTTAAVIVLITASWWIWAHTSPTRQEQIALDPLSTKTTTGAVSTGLSPLPATNMATPALTSSDETKVTSAINDILTDTSLDTFASARALGALVQDSTLSETDRAEALAHMLNLSVDDETKLLLPLLNSTKLPDALATTILTDSLNRPLGWQADACLAVMARPTGKELHAWAREHLSFLTDEDHGDNVADWMLAVRNARAKWQANDQ